MAQLHTLSDIWNNILVAWTAIKMNVNDSASAAESKLMDLLVNGVSKVSITKNGAVQASVGSLIEPSFAFLGDTGSGLYAPATGEMAISLTATEVMRLTSTAASFAVPIVLPTGTSAAPAIAASSANNAGINFFTPTSVSIVNSGLETVRFGIDGVMYYGQNGFAFPGEGNAQIGATLSKEGRLYLSGSANPLVSINRNTSGGTVVHFNREGTTVGTISVATSSTAYNTTSDYRLKNRVEPPQGYDLDEQFALLANDLTWFSFKAEPEIKQLGWMAHEFARSVPLGVTGEKDAVNEDGTPKHQMIDQSKSIPLIVARLDLLIQQVANLEAQLAELRGDE